jgi:hypothetical protein
LPAPWVDPEVHRLKRAILRQEPPAPPPACMPPEVPNVEHQGQPSHTGCPVHDARSHSCSGEANLPEQGSSVSVTNVTEPSSTLWGTLQSAANSSIPGEEECLTRVALMALSAVCTQLCNCFN